MGCCLSREPRRPSEDDSQPQRPPESAPPELSCSPRPPIALDERFNQPLRRTPWTASKPITLEQLRRARVEFWDTRVTGREEIWKALKMVVELLDHDVDTAQEIINASGITVPTGDLSKGVYDEQGNCYHLPRYCVCDPMNVAEPGAEEHDGDIEQLADITQQKAGKLSMDAEPEYELRARLSNNGGHDVTIKFSESEKVAIVLRRIAEEAKLAEVKLTMAYLGKVLKGDDSLPKQGWVVGNVVNVLVRPLN